MRYSLILAVCLMSTPLAAEVLTVPQGDPSGPVDRSQLPERGTSMQTVRARYGEPLSRSGPVGEPPITRWNYADFSVFFEYDKVLSGVIPNQPAPIYNQDELQPAYR